MVRVAAVGDIHFGVESTGAYRPHLERVAELADMLLVAGDLTRLGEPDEAAVVARELGGAPVPVVAVLGNHDYHSNRQGDVTRILTDAGIVVLEGSATTFVVGDATVGVAGAKGFGGGFVGACASDFGEPEMKAFIRHTFEVSCRLEDAIRSIDGADVRIVLLHYAPIEATLRGERPEIFPFLGSYLLGEAVDRCGADLIVHGHAHRGTERGHTPGGIPVRNVAQPVLGSPFGVYCIDREEGDPECRPMPAAVSAYRAVEEIDG